MYMSDGFLIAGTDGRRVKADNVAAMAHIADKYNMPAVGSEVRDYLERLKNTTENVGESYDLASKLGVPQCLRRCKALVRSGQGSPFAAFFVVNNASTRLYARINAK